MLAPNYNFLWNECFPPYFSEALSGVHRPCRAVALCSREACLLHSRGHLQSLLPLAHSFLWWFLEKGLEVVTFTQGACQAACHFLRFLTLQLLCFPTSQNSAEMSQWCGYVLCSLCVSGDPGPCVNWAHWRCSPPSCLRPLRGGSLREHSTHCGRKDFSISQSAASLPGDAAGPSQVALTPWGPQSAPCSSESVCQCPVVPHALYWV